MAATKASRSKRSRRKLIAADSVATAESAVKHQRNRRGGRCSVQGRPTNAEQHAYLWITLAFFLVSLALHWGLGWFAFADEAAEHGRQAEISGYLMEMGRDTFENWQSEFLQLIWQVVGLAFFLYVGSPSSKENDDRLEAKVDALLRINAGEAVEPLIREFDKTYHARRGLRPAARP